MKRYFIFDKFNTWYDWRLILTAKDIPDAEPKTNYVALDGMSGTLDLSEALTGEITYEDRTITATFWTDSGTRTEREKLLRNIRSALHGKKVKIIEPDDPDHYFLGRVKIKSSKNIIPYAEITIEAVCDPWRYATDKTVRIIKVNDQTIDAVIRNNGVKTICPNIDVTGEVTLIYNGIETELITGTYKIPSIKFKQGVSVLSVSGNGSVLLTYEEADL